MPAAALRDQFGGLAGTRARIRTENDATVEHHSHDRRSGRDLANVLLP